MFETEKLQFRATAAYQRVSFAVACWLGYVGVFASSLDLGTKLWMFGIIFALNAIRGFVAVGLTTASEISQRQNWFNELTWRYIFERSMQGAVEDWSALMREASTRAAEDIEQARSDEKLSERVGWPRLLTSLNLVGGITGLSVEVIGAYVVAIIFVRG